MFLYGRSSNCDNEFIFPVHSWITSHLPFDVDLDHLRRIYTEEKAKVVTAVWGTEFIQVLATLAILHPNEFKNSMNSSFSSCPPGAIHPFLHIILSPKEQRRPLPSLLYKSFFYGPDCRGGGGGNNFSLCYTNPQNKNINNLTNVTNQILSNI